MFIPQVILIAQKYEIALGQLNCAVKVSKYALIKRIEINLDAAVAYIQPHSTLYRSNSHPHQLSLRMPDLVVRAAQHIPCGL